MPTIVTDDGVGGVWAWFSGGDVWVWGVSGLTWFGWFLGGGAWLWVVSARSGRFGCWWFLSGEECRFQSFPIQIKISVYLLFQEVISRTKFC